MTTRGTPPSTFGRQRQQALVRVLNGVTTELYGSLVKSTPVGVGGRLQRSWVFTPASLENPVASIGSNSTYFLSLEMGRKPGSGISAEGQASVALWARRKLGKTEKEAKGFAYVLSRKYKKEGRGAQSILGLVPKGVKGGAVPNSAAQAVSGSLLSNAVKKLSTQLRSI